MSFISLTAAAGLDICRRIASGEFEVAGIQVRVRLESHAERAMRRSRSMTEAA